MATTPAHTQPVSTAIPATRRKNPPPIHSVAEDRQLTGWIDLLERAGDLAASASAVWVADTIYRCLGIGLRGAYAPRWLLGASLVFAAFFVLLLENGGEYKSGSLMGVRETERILRANCCAVFLLFALAFFSTHAYSRLLLLLVAVITPALVLLERQIVARLTRSLCHARHFGGPTIIYGSGRRARKVYSALLRTPKLGMMPVAFVDERTGMSGREVYEASYHRRQSATVLSGPVTAELLLHQEISSLILTDHPADTECEQILAAARQAGCTVYFAPGHGRSEDHALEYLEIDGFLFAKHVSRSERKLYATAKRTFDLAVSLSLLLLLAPALTLIALAVKCTSRGPVLFVQERVGRNGERFPMFKFRSMFVDAPAYAFSPRGSHDPRITPLGRFLRRTSLDELPQLLNVARGEMSLVGPRPEMPFIVERYSKAQRKRLEVTPGITGLWQLSADRAFLIHENIEYDLYYVRNRNFFLDLAILVHTAIFAARGV